QRHIDEAFANTDEWTRRGILNTANVGWFSSDRSIRGYAHDIWRVPIGVF
ncbi:MAG: glycogen/starch/alpha-glucan phosphorylase, partial [Hyphomicrobiales bacterium]|nr:glycogen/starch/alpha-glucan phosphorylase [Hyphomicrobiales bacterium]